MSNFSDADFDPVDSDNYTYIEIDDYDDSDSEWGPSGAESEEEMTAEEAEQEAKVKETLAKLAAAEAKARETLSGLAEEKQARRQRKQQRRLEQQRQQQREQKRYLEQPSIEEMVRTPPLRLKCFRD